MSYVWDDFGNVVSTQLPNHSLPTLYDYNAQGLLTRKLIEPSTSIAGRVLLDWAYDQLGRPVQSRENGTEVLSWQYDGNTVNQPPNCQTLLTSDYQAGRLTVASDPVWHTWYSYDADGQVVQEARTSRAFDSGGDCVTGEGMGIPLSTNPVISTTYTVNGAPLTLTYPTGRAVRIVRDHTHRPTSLAITYDSDPEPTHEIELETIRNISWWPGGQLRSYEVAARENLTAPASWSKISFRLGSGSSVATSALGTSCPSTEVDGTGVGDSSARLRAIYVTRGGQNVARFLYRWKGEQITGIRSTITVEGRLE